MMCKLTLGSPLTRLVSFHALCQCHVQTTSPRISTHVARSDVRSVCHRHRSFFSVFTKAKVTPFRTQYQRTRNETKCRGLGSSVSDWGGVEDCGMADGRLSYTADWSKHELLMTTCCGVWRHLPEGAHVIASYVDTAAAVHRTQRRQMLTALVAPSGLSDHIELKPLLDLMVKDGWRVVIPDMLGMSVIATKHSNIVAGDREAIGQNSQRRS